MAKAKRKFKGKGLTAKGSGYEGTFGGDRNVLDLDAGNGSRTIYNCENSDCTSKMVSISKLHPNETGGEKNNKKPLTCKRYQKSL